MAETAAATTAAAEETTAPAASAAAPAETAAQETQADSGTPSFYGQMDGIIFGFLSGVGAWETTLEIAPDGSFSGRFYDMDMGSTGEGYDHGTLYECDFTGRFGTAERVDDLTWKTKVEELNYEKEIGGSDHFIDDDHVLHVLTDPYGLELSHTVEFYLPGKKTADLSEEFMSWMLWKIPDGAEELDRIAFFDVEGGYGWYPDSYAMGEEETDPGDGGEGTYFYREIRDAYLNQEMPPYEDLPYVAFASEPVSPQYPSVTLENLQGRWVNRYRDGGSEVEEVLTVNGDHGMIETYIDGEKTGVWNGEGWISLEDRWDRKVCPALRIHDSVGDGICKICIRWVKEDSFYDGLFLCEWKKETPDDPAKQYLYDTVTPERLQGLWYSEYTDSAGLYLVTLNIEGDRATLFETVGGRPSSTWNGSGPYRIKLENFRGDIWYPELEIQAEEGPAGRGSYGIYITNVEEYRFYDPAFARWYYKVTPDYGADVEQGMTDMDGRGPEITFLDGGAVLVEGEYTCTVTPEGEMRDGHYDRWSIDVKSASGVDQTLELEIDPSAVFRPDAENLVSEADMNGDGITDLLLNRGCFGIHFSQSRECWLSDGQKLTRCLDFEDIPDPYVGADGLVYGSVRDGAQDWLELVYRIEGNRAVKVAESRHKIGEED